MLITILFVLACNGNGGGEKNDDSGSPDGAVDADRDGAFGDDDCDDAAPDVHPGAAETCNGVDDDCNGHVDDGIDVAFFRDRDGDGYGDGEKGGTGCSVPDGWVTDSTDCDDSAASVNPSQVEVCDAKDVDEDCSGLANEDDPGVTDIHTWYTDADGDGFGLATARATTPIPKGRRISRATTSTSTGTRTGTPRIPGSSSAMACRTATSGPAATATTAQRS